MAVPSDRLMELIGGGASGASDIPPPTPPMGMSEEGVPPMASPMSTPEPKTGKKEAAMVNVGMAMDLIEQTLPMFGSASEEGQKILSVIKSLSGLLGPRKNQTNELQQSEILNLLQNLPQAGGATPEGRAMAQAPAVPGMAGSMPPAAPSPTPM
jgi:hypothetical protein